MPLLAGREFTPADAGDAPKNAIVNRRFAEKFGLGQDAVGKWIASGGRDAELDTQIVGLSQNAKYSDVKGEIPALFFRPYSQNENIGSMFFSVRAATNGEQLLSALHRVVNRLDPNLPVENLTTMEAQVLDNVFVDRAIGVLSAAFASLATLLADVGLYGVLAYTVAQRTREIGLRMALGADAGTVRALVMRQVTRMTLVGGGRPGTRGQVLAVRGARHGPARHGRGRRRIDGRRARRRRPPGMACLEHRADDRPSPPVSRRTRTRPPDPPPSSP